MMRSLFSGVAGLRNHQSAMDVIGANISNVNTTGYKAGRSTFSDVISQTMQGASGATDTRGGTNPIQVGLGVGMSAVDTIMTSGSYQPTGKQTDLAIQNAGFFIVTDGSSKYYTRAGNFDFDAQGNFVSSSTGLKVMGWVGTNGVVDTSGGVTAIQIPSGITLPAVATTKMTYINNLSADAAPGATATTSLDVYDSLGNKQTVSQKFTKVGTNTWIAKASLSDTSITPTHTMTEITFDSAGKIKDVKEIDTSGGATTLAKTTAVNITAFQLDNTTGSVRDAYYTVFDANLDPHVLKMEFTQTANNTWSYKLTDSADTSGTSLINGNVTYAGAAYTFSGTFPATFTVGSGSAAASMTMAAPAGGLAPSGNTFSATATTTPSPAYTTLATAVSPFTFTATGANQSTITMDVSAVTQTGGSTTVQASEQNGNAAGALDSITIDTTGKIVGKFSNGKSQDLAQVAMATFTNEGGLTRVGDTMFAISNNSGNPSIGTSGTGGRGTLTPGTLEMSNIDLADQFSKMIITQRGFQSNSKIITVSDEMLEILANLKR